MEPESHPVLESLQRARDEAERLERRERLVTFTSSAGLVLVSIRGVVAVLQAARPAGLAPVLAVSLSLVIAACVGGLWLGRRWSRRLAELRQEIAWLEMERGGQGGERARPAVRHVYRTARDGAEAPRGRTAGEPVGGEPVVPRRGGWTAIDVAAAMAGVFLLLVCRSDAPEPQRHRWTFTEKAASLGDVGLSTPVERAGRWRVEEHPYATGGRALVNHAGLAGERPALAVTSAVRARDLRATTRCKVRSGAACGLVFRFHDPANYYVAHLDAASGRITLAAVVAGSERPISQLTAGVEGDIWQELGVEARAESIVVSWNGKAVIESRDLALPAAGGVGLWAPAEDVVLFDELTVEPLGERVRLL